MKLALIQCDVVDGNLAANGARLIIACQQAATDGAQLCIAPAQALAGPHCGCLVQQPDFALSARQTVEQIAKALATGPALLCALPEIGYLLIQKGEVGIAPTVFEFGGKRLGLDAGPEEMGNIDIGINMTARPFIAHVQADWELILSGVASQARIWALSVNLSGGYGAHIYNGQSVAARPDGAISARAKAFAEDILLIDTESNENGRIEPLCPSLQAAIWAALRLGLSDFFTKAGVEKAILGLSGGMDSALVACLAADALGPDDVTGVLMPSSVTSDESLTDATELADNLGIQALVVSIEPMYEAFQQELAGAFTMLQPVANELTDENLQARIRGVALMALANKTGALVLNTGNKSEAAMGYCTLYGDTVGALAVIGDLFKTEVYDLASWYCQQKGSQCIPQNIFDKAPTAELRPGQLDTDSLPPYEKLDPDLRKILAGSRELADNQELRNLRARVFAAQFKRKQIPPALIVSGAPLASCRM